MIARIWSAPAERSDDALDFERAKYGFDPKRCRRYARPPHSKWLRLIKHYDH